MRLVKEIRMDVLSRAGRYREVYPENSDRTKPSPLKVKEVHHNGRRYIVCFNERQARKDAADRQAIIESLKEQFCFPLEYLFNPQIEPVPFLPY